MSNTIIMTLTNRGGIPLTDNMLKSLETCGMIDRHSLVVYCTDEYSLNYYGDKYNTQRTDHVPCDENHVDFSTLEFTNICRNKQPSIVKLLKEGNDVIYIDNDIFVNRDFTDDIETRWKEHNLLLQDDNPGTPYCAGFMCLKANKDVISLLESSIMINDHEVEVKGNFRMNDQLTLHIAMQNNMTLYNDVGCLALPRKLYPNGHVLKDNGYDRDRFFIAHANYVIGMEEKVKLLKDHNCWLGVSV